MAGQTSSREDSRGDESGQGIIGKVVLLPRASRANLHRIEQSGEQRGPTAKVPRSPQHRLLRVLPRRHV